VDRKPWDEVVIFKALVLQALYTRISRMARDMRESIRAR